MCPRRGAWWTAFRNCFQANGWSGGAALPERTATGACQPEGKSAGRPKTAEAELDRLLKLSVREHLEADVPLGVWLSGGLDSSSLLHYAAEASRSRLKTFSITFRGRSFDEMRYARQVADWYGTEHTELDLNTEQDLPGAIHELAYYCDEPNADSGALPVWFLSRLTKASATVALSGEGADELFGGYLMHRASLLARSARRLPPTLLRSLLATAQQWPVSNDKIGFEYKLKRFLEGCRMPAARAHAHWSGTFDDQEKRSLLQPTLPPALDSVLRELESTGDHLQAYLLFDQKYFLPDNILTKVDHASMAHAVEVRPPFLDHRIVEFASSLPTSLKIQGSRQKVILRDLMRAKLSPAILKRKKIGFDIPTHDWFRGPLLPLLQEAVTFASAEHGEFFRIPRIEAHVRAHLDRRANLGFHLWGLMMLFFWMKKWRIRTRVPVGTAHRTMERVFTSTLIVLFVAAAVYAGCMISPPSLMDDVDAVQAQIARNMLTSGDWVTARLDGIPYLEKAPLIYWLIAGSFKIFGATDWAARSSHRPFRSRTCVADHRVWDLGIRARSRILQPVCAYRRASAFFFSRAF